jgi:hypothetical protein
MSSARSDIFLLSPAYCGGRRAVMLLEPRSNFPTAAALAGGTLTLGEAFTFMSGLYFRGKLAYASTFGRALVITPTRGLMAADAIVSPAMLREFSGVDIKTDERFRRSLERSARALEHSLTAHARVILLGSVATSKYVDVLADVFGPRLLFPPTFIGRGDMSRGGLMLRSARSGVPLEYTQLTAGAIRRGPRPPKLPKLPRAPAGPVVHWRRRLRR